MTQESSKTDKVWQSWMGYKMPLYKWHTFQMAPCLICYFIVILFYIERKWLLMRNLATVLPLKSKLSGKLQRFIIMVEVSKNWKIVKFRKISIKMKNCKTFYETQTQSHLTEIIQLPPTSCTTRKNVTTPLKQKFS